MPTLNGANAPDAVMWTIAQVAARDGVSRPTVSVRVKRFREQHGLHVETDGQGHVARLNVAQYDALRGRYDDPTKAQQRTPDPKRSDHESYDEAIRQKTWLDAEKRRLEVDELKGRLVDAAVFAATLDKIAARFKDLVAMFEESADDIAVAVGRDGGRGARAECKRIGFEIATVFADFLAA
jgi:hypothetical protein